MHNICDQTDASIIPSIRPLSWAKSVFIAVISPLLVLFYGLKLLVIWQPKNTIKRYTPITGKKNGAFSSDIDLATMKLWCKKNNCTINDYTTAIVCKAMHQYCLDHSQDEDGTQFKIPDSLMFGIVFSLRQLPKRIVDVNINNQIGVLPI